MEEAGWEEEARADLLRRCVQEAGNIHPPLHREFTQLTHRQGKIKITGNQLMFSIQVLQATNGAQYSSTGNQWMLSIVLQATNECLV